MSAIEARKFLRAIAGKKHPVKNLTLTKFDTLEVLADQPQGYIEKEFSKGLQEAIAIQKEVIYPLTFGYAEGIWYNFQLGTDSSMVLEDGKLAYRDAIIANQFVHEAVADYHGKIAVVHIHPDLDKILKISKIDLEKLSEEQKITGKLTLMNPTAHDLEDAIKFGHSEEYHHIISEGEVASVFRPGLRTNMYPGHQEITRQQAYKMSEQIQNVAQRAVESIAPENNVAHLQPQRALADIFAHKLSEAKIAGYSPNILPAENVTFK